VSGIRRSDAPPSPKRAANLPGTSPLGVGANLSPNATDERGGRGQRLALRAATADTDRILSPGPWIPASGLAIKDWRGRVLAYHARPIPNLEPRVSSLVFSRLEHFPGFGDSFRVIQPGRISTAVMCPLRRKKQRISYIRCGHRALRQGTWCTLFGGKARSRAPFLFPS
jgi:hypothetical protein